MEWNTLPLTLQDANSSIAQLSPISLSINYWSEMMNDKSVQILHRWIGWTGPFCMLTFFACWIWLGHNFPPPDPTYTAAELVTNYYGKYRSSIMLGESMGAAFGMFYLPWTCLLTAQMMQREKRPVLAMMQLTGGLLTAWILAMCPCMWVWCAEEANVISPDIIKTLHFVAWYIFNMTYMITTIQYVAVGLFALLDKQKPVLIPRWAGWLAILIGLSFIPLTALPFHKTGPLAINGWWAFHGVVTGFGIVTLVFTHCMLKEARRMRVSPALGIGQAISN